MEKLNTIPDNGLAPTVPTFWEKLLLFECSYEYRPSGGVVTGLRLGGGLPQEFWDYVGHKNAE